MFAWSPARPRAPRADTNLHYRADIVLLSGLGFKNSSSYWLGDSLYIYTFDIDNCVRLDLGFGMMQPDWFITGASVFGSVYSTQRSDSADNAYHSTVLSRKDGAGQGYFDYYSRNSTGAAFTMHAPSPAGFVVNEYIIPPTPTPFTADAPVFALPVGIPCVNTTLSAARAHPGGLNAHLAELIGAPGFRLALPELAMAGVRW